MKLDLGSRLYIERLIRYSIWDLLADVGGFNDGIILVCKVFMSGYSAIAFKTEFFNRSSYDTGKDPRKHKYSSYRSVLNDLN